MALFTLNICISSDTLLHVVFVHFLCCFVHAGLYFFATCVSLEACYTVIPIMVYFCNKYLLMVLSLLLILIGSSRVATMSVAAAAITAATITALVTTAMAIAATAITAVKVMSAVTMTAATMAAMMAAAITATMMTAAETTAAK